MVIAGDAHFVFGSYTREHGILGTHTHEFLLDIIHMQQGFMVDVYWAENSACQMCIIVGYGYPNACVHTKLKQSLTHKDPITLEADVAKNNKSLKNKMIKELQKLAPQYMDERPDSISTIMKSWWLEHTMYDFDNVLEFWPNFAAFKKEALGVENRNALLREQRKDTDNQDLKLKQKLIDSVHAAAQDFYHENPSSNSALKRSFWIDRSGYGDREMRQFWPTFSAMLTEVLGTHDKRELLRSKRENLSPEDEALRAEILLDVQECIREYARENPNSNSTIKKSWYFENGKHTEADVKKFWDDFGSLKKEAMGSDGVTRDNFSKAMDFRSLGPNKRYFVTTLIAGMPLNSVALNAGVADYCKRMDAELVILLQRGPISSYQGYPQEAGEQADRFVTECIFNNNLQAFDLMLNPQQISPLISVGRIAQYKTSVIIASPKQDMDSYPVSQGSKLPHIGYTTGSISLPEYRPNRAGRLATLDHVNGGLIVEVRNEEEFHTRQVQFDEWGGFYDVDGGYFGDPHTKSVRGNKGALGLSLGDIHFGMHNEAAVAGWKRLIRQIRPRYVFFHDLVNHESINHHQDNDIVARAMRPTWARNLETELDMVAFNLEEWCTEFKDVEFVVVKSNHDEWLDQYITKSKFSYSDINIKVCAQMMLWMLDGKDPLAEYMHMKLPMVENLRFLRRDQDFKLADIQCGAHGDLTANGNRKGGIRAIERAYGSAVVGHAHTAGILRRTWVNGTTSELNQHWMKGPTSQTHSSTIIWYGGSRQMITLINGVGYLADSI